MAKGPHLTDRIRDLIAQIYVADRQVTPGKAHEQLLRRMKAEGLNEIFGSNYPSRSTVSKELKRLRANDEARSPESKGLDQPWSVGCLGKYHIPAEALPLVMTAYQKRLSEDDVLTVREALWMGRLYGIIEPKDLVYDWAFLYATWEMVYELQGKPFDSRELDLEMIANPHAARETQREIAIWEIAERYGADPVELKDLNLSIEETEEIAKSGKFRKEAQDEAKGRRRKEGSSKAKERHKEAR